MENVFDKQVSERIIHRIDQLTPHTKALWGKMNVGQMLAHCNVSYELVYDNIHPRPVGFKKFLLKLFVKKATISEKMYKPNMPTGPMFIMKGEKDFDQEKKRLTDYIRRTQEKGAAYFDGKESHSFGVLSASEWNNMFYKHLDHHLRQFGA